MQDPPPATSSPTSPSLSLDDQDESVRIAVRALGAMRNGTQSQSTSIETCEYIGPTYDIFDQPYCSFSTDTRTFHCLFCTIDFLDFFTFAITSCTRRCQFPGLCIQSLSFPARGYCIACIRARQSQLKSRQSESAHRRWLSNI